jgi:hypothetical protein
VHKRDSVIRETRFSVLKMFIRTRVYVALFLFVCVVLQIDINKTDKRE